MLLESTDPAPTVVFSDTSALYAHTIITGLYFIYSAKPMVNITACELLASTLSNDEAIPHRLTLNGIQFTARYGEDADPNDRRGIVGTTYSTFRAGICYLFETTATTYDRANSSADDDYNWAQKNHIHAVSWTAIEAQLFDILRSVHITPADTTSADTPSRTFLDPESGLSFQYPSAWEVVPAGHIYNEPVLFQSQQAMPPVLEVKFFNTGPYTKTNLEWLAFSYFRKEEKSSEDCKQFAKIASGDGAPPNPRTINGVSYTVSKGTLRSSGGAKTYATYRNGFCYAFESDFATVQFPEGTQKLSPSETQTLQDHLDAIMQTVSFGAQ